MDQPHLLIIGGGLAGLSAGCHARRNGYRTTIVEHASRLGGVCTAWQRAPYVVDGCIHWLTGGPFEPLYRELGILPAVPLRVLDPWVTWRDEKSGVEVVVERDLDRLVARLTSIAPADRDEIFRIRDGARELVDLHPPIDAPELSSLGQSLRRLWDIRAALPALVHFRKSLGTWSEQRLTSDTLRRLCRALVPEQAPALFLLMVLGYLERGWLSRPIGGTAAFRDALERSYRALGGEAMLDATVEEVLVDGDRAHGVRLIDGRMLRGHAVVSTASAPDTVLRMLGGRYDAGPTRERLATWKLFDPIVLVSFGVATRYAQSPSLMVIDGITPLEVGGRSNDRLHVRVCNDDESFAPEGHTVIQAMLTTDYRWWATRGDSYGAEKERVARDLLARLEPTFPGIHAAVRMTDVATPMTYWTNTRAWRGAYEGWMPPADHYAAHVDKKLAHLDGFYMAGQWVEPGGGVPTAVLSGRQAVQLVCADDGRAFVSGG